MGKFGEERFADQLVLSLADESTAVRLAAINAIVRHRPETRTRAAHQLARRSATSGSAPPRRRRSANIAITATIEPLMRHLMHDPPPVRIAVIDALGKSEDAAGQGRAVPLSRASPIRRSSARRCWRWRASRATTCSSVLVARSRSEDWRLRAAAGDGPRHPRRSRRAAGAAPRARRFRHLRAAVRRCWRSTKSRTVRRSRICSRRWRTRPSSTTSRKYSSGTSDLYRDLLEEAWRTADSRREVVIAAILRR